MLNTNELCVIASWDDLGLSPEAASSYVEKLLDIVERISKPENWDVPALLACA